jgi:hypothetical protein
MSRVRALVHFLLTQKKVEAQEIQLAVGILLTAAGVAQWSAGAACIVAGLIVLALAWPARPRAASPSRDRMAG